MDPWLNDTGVLTNPVDAPFVGLEAVWTRAFPSVVVIEESLYAWAVIVLPDVMTFIAAAAELKDTSDVTVLTAPPTDRSNLRAYAWLVVQEQVLVPVWVEQEQDRT